MPSKDPFHDPGFVAYARHVVDEMLPQMEGSAVTMAVVPGGAPDVQFATQLGFMIMLDKPIIAVVLPGVKVPPKLAMIADAIVEGKMDDPTFPERMKAAMERVTR